MSFGPVAPSVAELLHHLASVAVHEGGWILVDAVIAGAPAAAWPLPEEPAPALVAGDLCVVRPAASHAEGSTDAILFQIVGAQVQVSCLRRAGGELPTWDTGAHIIEAGTSTVTLDPVSPQAAGTYGDVVAVDGYGILLVQVVSTGTLAARAYWGHLLPNARNPDGTGGDVGDDPLPGLLGWAEFNGALTGTGDPEVRLFVERDITVRAGFPFEVASTFSPNKSGDHAGTLSAVDAVAAGDISTGVRDYPHGRIPMLRHLSSAGISSTMTQLRDPISGDRFLAFGDPLHLSVGPLAPAGEVRYRILSFGGPIPS